jgi:hypothetical protein
VLPIGGCRVRLGMENRFFVEANSFVFVVVEGKSVLRSEEKRDGFSGVVFLGSRCTAWLVLMGEEVLLNPGVEKLVKSFQEGLKVLIG